MAEFPDRIHLTLVTRERKILEAEVHEVVLPAVNGALGVLPGHTPLLAELKIGELTYRQGTDLHHVVISWGYAEVLADRVIVVADGAVLADEIDAADSEQKIKEAERQLASLASHDEGFALAQAKLDQSMAEMSVASRRRDK